MEGFIEAVADTNYNRAALYLNHDPALGKDIEGAGLAQALQRLLDRQGDIIPFSWISNEPGGNADDNLGPNLDRVGTATVNGESFDILVEMTEGPQGEPIWLFSSQTVQRIPADIEASADISLVDSVLPEFLEERTWGGVPAGHWLAMLLLAALAYLLAWSITSFALLVIPLLWHRAREEPTAGIIKAFALPIRLYLTVLILVPASQAVGISIIVRQGFSEATVIVALVALLLLLWQLIEFLTGFFERRLTRHGNLAGFSAVLFLRRGAKLALIAFGAIAILSTLGFDVTTGLAALGIGGIALALGAQKTVENFVGSVTLIADQPVRVGDFCKVGDTVGTVEQIGMRSTRIRTNDRTVVTIPNGDFSSQKIENYAHRDRFWFHPVLNLRYETTPAQIRFLLSELRAVMLANPKVDPDPARIRFVEMGAHSLNLEVFAYVHATNFGEFLEIQEDLFLRMMDVVEASGTEFAFPSQTLYMARDKFTTKEKQEGAAERVQKQSESDEK